MKFLWFALVAVVIAAAQPEVEKSSEPEAGEKTSPQCEPGCIGNFQRCIESTKPCCRLEDRTSVQFGREEYICDRFLGGLCAPLEVITNLPLYLELSQQLNETNLLELSKLYWAAVFPTKNIEPESQTENKPKVDKANQLNTNSIELTTAATPQLVPEVSSTCIGNYEKCVNADKPCCSKTLRYGDSTKLRKFVCDTDGQGICVPFYGYDRLTGLPRTLHKFSRNGDLLAFE